MSNAIEVQRIKTFKNKEYGDFQTPFSLTNSICNLIKQHQFKPTILIEPSCGKGNFVISALKTFPSIKNIIAIEIQEHYKEELYANLTEADIDLESKKIIFINESFFDINFKNLLAIHNISEQEDRFLILGNPPWVTNSFLGSINSLNIPNKTNSLVKFKGLDALTGKSNFDITEIFILKLMEYFSGKNAIISLICKTATVHNLLKNYFQNFSKFQLSTYLFDAKREFGISASANVFQLKKRRSEQLRQRYCSVYTLADYRHKISSFGYRNNYFVSNIDLYNQFSSFEGDFYYQWRQGLKHDAGSVLVLEKISPGLYQNKLMEKFELEDDLVYPFLKSSDIKGTTITKSRYFIIVTQEKLNEDVDRTLEFYPKTHVYLEAKEEFFLKRKSKIYKNRSKFCIFGIGDYSFKPFKIVVSGFYKKLNFALVLPYENKTIMIDDTCYSLSFDRLDEAVLIWTLLNTKAVKNFFTSITFTETKRPYKKDVLQRLDIKTLLETSVDSELENIFQTLDEELINFSFNRVLKVKNDLINKFQDSC